MLNFTVKPGEYFTIGEDIQVVFIGGSKNHCKIMVDAPRKYNIVRGTVLEKNAVTEEEKKSLKQYYKEPELPANVIQKMKEKQKNYVKQKTAAN